MANQSEKQDSKKDKQKGKVAKTAANRAARLAKAMQQAVVKKAKQENKPVTAHGTARAAKREETLRLKKELQEAIAWDKAKKEKELYDKDIAYATKHFPVFMGEYGEGQYLQRDELRELCKAINALKKKWSVSSCSSYMAGVFIWSDTVQGYAYWSDVAAAIKDRKESVQESLQ